MKSRNKDQLKKILTEVKTFTVPFSLEDIKEYITITTNTPSKNSKEHLINQALKYHSQGNISEAAKYYQNFISQGFKDHRVFSNYGVILIALGKLKEARLLLSQAIEINPNFAEAHSNLGTILIDLGNLKQAEISTRKAIELKPFFSEAHLSLGNIMAKLGNLEEAELSIRKAIQINPNFAEAHSNLGGILIDLGKSKEAELSILKAIKLNPNFAEAHLNRGIIWKNFGNLEEAELSIRKAIQLNPNFAEAHSNLGLINKSLGNLNKAELSIRKAIQINPNFAEAHLNLGNIMRNLGNAEEAELSIHKAIQLNPNSPEAYSNLGAILIDLGKLKAAELSLRKAIELKPDFHQAYRELGICLYLLEDIDSALNFVVKANDLDPKDITSQLLLSIFQKEKKNINKNIKINSFKIGLDKNPLILNMPVEEALINDLYKIKARDQEKFQGPTYGDTKGSDYNLFERSDSSIIKFKEKLIPIIRNSMKSDILISESFFTIFRSGGGLKSHNHLIPFDKIKGLNIADRKYSLVYYLSVGDQSCDEPGILKMEEPKQDILPNDGLIIIFPAGRKHSIFYEGQKDRIIIGVNFYSF